MQYAFLFTLSGISGNMCVLHGEAVEWALVFLDGSTPAVSENWLT